MEIIKKGLQITKICLIGFVTVCFCAMAVVFIYLSICFLDTYQPPATYNLNVKPVLVKQGQDIDVVLSNLVRHKACHIVRIVQILAANNRVYEFIKITDPTDLGVASDDFVIPFEVPNEAAVGPATLTYTVKSQCPNNIIEYYHPSTQTTSRSFVILSK